MYTARRSNSWVMVEMLDPATDPTAVSGGDGGKDFVVLTRLVDRAINAARVGADVTTADVVARILDAQHRRTCVDAVLGQGSAKHVLIARPVLGPQQRVHGVQYWLGPVDEEPPEPRRACGVVWDLPAKLVHLTIDCNRMAGVSDDRFVPSLPLATFWHNANRFDHHEEVYRMLHNPCPRASFRTTGNVRNIAHQDDMYWQATIRTRYDKQTVGAWGLLEDLSYVLSRPPKVTLEQAAMRDYLRSEQTYLGVIHVPDGAVVRWLTDPPPWMDCTLAPDRIFPAEDLARLANATAPDEGIVRAINRDNSYTPTKIVLLPYHGRKGPFAIGHFLRADARH